MNSRLLISVSILLFFGLMLTVGCSEEEVPYVIDDEEILRYLNESEDAQELFRTDNLFGTDEYTVPGDTAVYKIVVDSVKRRIDLDSHVDTVRTFETGGTVEYYRLRHVYPTPLGEIFGDCEATVDDIFYLRNLRIAGTDTTVSRSARAVNRYGFLMKLGGDNQAYRGWKLWAYNGGSPAGSMVITSDNYLEFRGDAADREMIQYTEIRESLTYGTTYSQSKQTRYAYRRLDAIATVPPGDMLYLNCYDVATNSYYRLVSADKAAGARLQSMDRVAARQYLDTLQTPTNNPRLWNLLFMQDYQRVLIPGSNPPEYTINWTGWCVPYRVEQ